MSHPDSRSTDPLPAELALDLLKWVVFAFASPPSHAQRTPVGKEVSHQAASRVKRECGLRWFHRPGANAPGFNPTISSRAEHSSWRVFSHFV